MDTRKNYYIDNFTHETAKAIAKQTDHSLKDVLIEAINELADKISDSEWNGNLQEIPGNCGVGYYVKCAFRENARNGVGERSNPRYNEPAYYLYEQDFLRNRAEIRRTYYVSFEHHRMLLLIATMLDIEVSDALSAAIITLGRKYQTQGYDIFKVSKPISGARRFLKLSKSSVAK